MKATAALILLFGLAACAAPPSSMAEHRIVSIDYCADQMLLGLVERERIAAVSVDVGSDPLFAAPRAEGLPRVKAELERIIALRPTLVVRSYGGGPRLEAMVEQAGVQVFTLPYADSIAAARQGVLTAGDALDARDAARVRVAALDAAVAVARRERRHTAATALYMTPGDVTTGPGGLIAELIETAGYRSYEQRPGWHRLPVEQLMAEKPQLVVRGFFESDVHRQDRWAASGHVALAAGLRDVPSVDVPGSTLACGNWLAGDALLAIARAGL